MLTPEQFEAVRAYVTALGDPAADISESYGRMRAAVGGWPAVARLLLAQGETHFEGLEDARAAGREYERIVADAVHGEELARLRAEVDELQHAIRVAWEAIDATTSLEIETAMHTLIQAVPLAVRQRWAREDGEG